MNLPPLPPLPEKYGIGIDPETYWTVAQLRTYAEQYGRLCAEAGAESERAECAKLADEKAEKVNSRWIANDIADAIRARSQR